MRLGVFLAFLALFFSFCSNDSHQQEQRLVGYWRLLKYSTNQQINQLDDQSKMFYQKVLSSTWLDFRPDGKMSSYIWEVRSDGQWRVIKPNKLEIIGTDGSRYVVEFRFDKQGRLILIDRNGKVVNYMYFVRY